MFVFRVEDNNGNGPYNALLSSSICNIFNYHQTPQNHGYSPNKSHFFAWESLEKFKEMVSYCCMKKFSDDTDWKMSIYEVNEDDENTVILPDGQVMFYKSRARLVKRVQFGNINRLRIYK